jgi:hypothetical protein
MAYFEDSYPEYVLVAERCAKAERKIVQLRKKNPNLKPVIIEGRACPSTVCRSASKKPNNCSEKATVWP